VRRPPGWLCDRSSDDGHAYLEPGLRFDNPIDTISLGLGLVLGTAGLPHILMRFFTVPDAKAARTSVVWAVGLIGAFYVMTTFLGFGARAILGEAGATGGVDEAGNLAAPLLAQEVGGGDGTVGGDAFLAIIAAVAFATILAVVAGLVISASGAVAHDVWSNVIRKGRDSEHEEVYVARIAAGVIGAIAIVIAVIGGSDLNVSYMVVLAFAVAASANFPALLLALTWKRFNTTGAVTGVLWGVVSSVGLVLLGPDVRSDPLINLSQPGIISIPIGFLGCILGTLLSKPEGKADHQFEELRVRSETGIGAERPVEGAGLAPRPRKPRPRVPAGREAAPTR
jgi:cation/acetate symporter